MYQLLHFNIKRLKNAIDKYIRREFIEATELLDDSDVTLIIFS